MKFLHIADLHLGKVVNGFSMLSEQQHVLEQIINYVEQEEPQAVLIAGDVYDKAVPATEAVRLFDQFLTNLVARSVQVMLVSGNHDSGERLAFGNRIMQAQGVHVQGVFSGQMHSVTVGDADGGVDFCLLPYIKPSYIRRHFPHHSIESYNDAWQIALRTHMATHRRRVLLAHQFVVARGVDPERSESEIEAVGGLDSVYAEVAAEFQYVALGHLHGAQRVGYEHIRYAGSPLKYSFSECHHRKGVLLVDMDALGQVAVHLLPLRPLHDMRMIAGPLQQLLSSSVVNAGDPFDYLHVTLTDEQELNDAIGQLRLVYPNTMKMEYANRRSQAEGILGIPDVENVSPLQLFSQFYEKQNAQDLRKEQVDIISALLDSTTRQEGDR